MDEKAAPDLLVFKEDIISAVTEMAKRQVSARATVQRATSVACCMRERISTLLNLGPRLCNATKGSARPDARQRAQGVVKSDCRIQGERITAMESNPDVELERIVYERDLQRTRWLIKAYYRTRIRKIEAHVQHYLHHQEYTSRLSAAELEYAKDYFTCIGRCGRLRSTGLCEAPAWMWLCT